MEEQKLKLPKKDSSVQFHAFAYVIVGVFIGLIVGFFSAFLYLKNIAISPNVAITKTEESAPAELPPQAALHVPVCIPRGPQAVKCHAQVVINKSGQPDLTSVPQGYGPVQFQTAYSLLGKSSSGRIVAIIDAYDNPNIKPDLDTYSGAFGLPVLPTCQTTIKDSATPCFQKIDQRGGTSYPAADSSWALEIALDTEVVHAACPDCKILLVEADSNTYDSLLAAEDKAVALGASVVSNSYGSGEFSSETSFDSHFNVAGVAFTFSSGDAGYGSTYPAASRYVTAVGGTTLLLNSNNTYKNETAWSGAGSGCSNFEIKPTWQSDKGCPMRTIVDVSADADPSSAAAVYDTVPYGGTGQTGWFQVGGTSLASPLVAAVFALKGVPPGTQANSLPYLSATTGLNDVTRGSNGGCPQKNKYLCSAVVGYDGPTGLGTPKGIGAF